MSIPTAPHRSIIPGDPGQNLLRRVLKVHSDASDIDRIVLVEAPHVRITLRDTGPEGISPTTASGDVAIHLLWAMDDDTARLSIDGRETPIAPGDMIVFPAGTTWHTSPGMILCEIDNNVHENRAGTKACPCGPTHGVETFHGYNRETTYPAPPGLRLSRWKITQPLELPAMDHDRYIIDLAAPVAIVWPTGADLIGRGECRQIPPATGPITLLPDGLGYVLIVMCSSLG